MNPAPMGPRTPPDLPDPLPLFPLRTVLFPGAVLGLKVFEARYLDLVTDCMRSGQPFGVICLRGGGEVGHGPKAQDLESVGVLAHVDDVDADQAGILEVRCKGGQRFRLQGTAEQRSNGLWVAKAKSVPADQPRVPGPAMIQTVTALSEIIHKLREQEQSPFEPPYHLDEAGWVANRWCELLPISLAAKQKLMELDDPVIRLSLVDGFLRDRKIVVG